MAQRALSVGGVQLDQLAALHGIEEIAPATIALRRAGGVAEGQKEAATVDIDPVERQLSGHRVECEADASGAPEAHCVWPAGLDLRLLRIRVIRWIGRQWGKRSLDAQLWRIGEVAQPGELRARVRCDGRLGMPGKQRILPGAEVAQRLLFVGALAIGLHALTIQREHAAAIVIEVQPGWLVGCARLVSHDVSPFLEQCRPSSRLRCDSSRYPTVMPIARTRASACASSIVAPRNSAGPTRTPSSWQPRRSTPARLAPVRSAPLRSQRTNAAPVKSVRRKSPPVSGQSSKRTP